MNESMNGTEQRQPSKVSAAQLPNGVIKNHGQDQHTPTGIAQKLLAIMRDLDYIRKDKRNSEHGYTYASEAAIKREVQSALVSHGVLFELSAVSYTERPAGKEGRDTLILMQFVYAFEDADSGERREGTFYGSGIDGRDKGLYKAITGAIKYILTSRFLIPTGDDPENDDTGDADPVGRSIDTGGAPWGTRAAAQNVAARKLAEIRAEEPPPPKPSVMEKPWRSKSGMAECFRVARERVGEVIWNAVLRQSGVDSPAQFKESADALAAYNLMLGLAKEGLKNDVA